MLNREIANAFDTIADLLEITGGDRFRINSYRRAARTVGDLVEDVAELAADDRLTSLPDIGKGTAAKIKQYIETQTIKALEDLRAEVPEGLPELLEISGLGPKKVALAWKELNVASLDDLVAAIEDGRLAGLPGMGEKSVKKIADGIAFRKQSGGRVARGIAVGVAGRFADYLRELKAVKRVEIVGSLRRGCETVGDVDLLCETSKGKQVIEAFTGLPEAAGVLAAGETKGSITVDAGHGRAMQIDCRAIPSESFGAALQYFTGSKEHNIRLREIAIRKKLRLNEYGLFDGERRVAGKTEEGVYHRLGVRMVPPELREDRGEFEHPEIVDKLVTLEDIRGDLHVHTTASDGRNTIEEMARAAKRKGYAYIAICDHSKSSAVANGLSVERMATHIEDIRRVDEQVKGVKVFVSCECDILADGSLDYPDEILAECDLVVASIHSGLSSDRKVVTRRTLRAMENPYVTIIGHPTGRLINTRAAMDLDMSAVIRTAGETNTILEISAAWQRLDLKDLHVRQAIEAGVKLVIATDAHDIEQLDQIPLGVTTARRGWATKDDILNTRPLAQFKKQIAIKRNP